MEKRTAYTLSNADYLFHCVGEIFVFCHSLLLRFAALITCFLSAAPHAATVCDGPREAHQATPESIQAFIRGKNKSVLTFSGYSGAGYQDPEAMLKHAARVLDEQNPGETLIDIGATAIGIGAVYALAKQKGFTTMGIVSSLAREEHAALSDCVDYVFFVPDNSWGGLVPGSNQLSPTSAAIVAASMSIVATGGGDVTRYEALAARSAGKPVTFIPADMDHEIAKEKARKRGTPEPIDFRGSAHAALAP